MVRLFGKFWWLGCVFSLAACDDTAVGGPSEDILSSNADATDDVSILGGKDAIEDISPEKAACVGSALEPGMSVFDYQCKFLDQCEHMASCYCGDGCSDTKIKCDDQYCPNAHPKCYCGDGCDAKLVMCPNYICNASPSTGCEAHDDCVFNNAKAPDWCGCQKMPDHCSCGSDCLPNVALCDAKVCKNYPTKGCSPELNDKKEIKTYTNCYCERCGTLAHTPRCYFLQCPGAKP